MKKVFAILSIATLMIACGENKTDNAATSDTAMMSKETSMDTTSKMSETPKDTMAYEKRHGKRWYDDDERC